MLCPWSCGVADEEVPALLPLLGTSPKNLRIPKYVKRQRLAHKPERPWDCVLRSRPPAGCVPRCRALGVAVFPACFPRGILSDPDGAPGPSTGPWAGRVVRQGATLLQGRHQETTAALSTSARGQASLLPRGQRQVEAGAAGGLGRAWRVGHSPT